MARTMFERYGGFGTVSKLVMEFYDRLLDSDLVAPYFEGVDMRRLIDHQTKFISSVMGGPASYTNETLRQVHAHLDIDRASFDEMVRILTEAMEDLEFDPADVDFVIADIESRAPYIVQDGKA